MPGPDLRVLSSGIDSLYVSANGELYDGLLVVFKDMRELWPNEDIVFEWHENEGSYLLRRHGWRGYPYWMSSPNVEIMVGAARPFPPLYAQLHSSFLHSLGPEAAVAEVERTLRTDFFPNGYQLIPSRVDVYADVQGWVPGDSDFRRFICRGVRRRMFHVPLPQELHGVRHRVSGFTFGKGDVVARIYDKTLEMSSKGETWPETNWTGRDVDQPVWRIEFQFRREALQSVQIREVGQAIALRQGLWDYGMQWLSLRQPSAHARPARWPEDPVWSTFRGIQLGRSTSPLIREHIRSADERRLVAGFLGYVSSIAAMSDVNDVDGALQRTRPLAEKYLRERGVGFDATVIRKRALRRAVRGDAPAPVLLASRG